MLKKEKLGNISNLINGKAFKPSDWSDKGIPIIRIQNLNDVDKPFNYWAGSLKKQILINDNDVLLAWSGTPGTSFGAHIWDRGSAVLNQHIFRVDLDENVILKNWAILSINYQLQKLIDQAHGGVGLKHVTKGIVESLEIPLPSLTEQKRIINIFERTEAIRQKRQQSIKYSKDLLRATFQHMFYKKECSWKIVNLESVCTNIKDGTHKTPSYTSGGIPFLTVKNIVSGQLDFVNTKFISEDEHNKLSKRIKPENGDILVSKDGTIGMPCVVDTDREFSIFVSLALLKLKRDIINPFFLADQFKTTWIQRQIANQIKGIAIRHLHLTDFKKLKIILPSEKYQSEYVKISEKIKIHIRRKQDSIGEMNRFYNSISQRAFRGDL